MLDFSLLCLNCDRFVIELIGISFYTSNRDTSKSNHDRYLDFCYHNQCKTQDLAKALDNFNSTERKLELVVCRFPLESYIGKLLTKKYQQKDRTERQTIISTDSSKLDSDRKEEYINRLSFQYLDTRVIFSNPQYHTRFRNAIALSKEKTDFEKALVESTAIAYRTAWLYYGKRKGNTGIWTF